jgi:membrane protein
LAFNQLSKDAGFLLGIGIILAMFGASRLFITIDKCLTIVYRLPERTFLRQNLLAFGMLFIFILLVIIMLSASSAPSVLISIIPGGGGRFGAFIAGILSSLLVSFVLFEVIYWIVPNKKMSFKVTWCGALVAACTLEIFIISFPLYVRRFMGNYAGKFFRKNISKINSFFLHLSRSNWFCCYSSFILILFCYNTHFGCSNKCFLFR